MFDVRREWLLNNKLFHAIGGNLEGISEDGHESYNKCIILYSSRKCV